LQVDIPIVLEGCHVDVCGGHFIGNSIGQKTLLVGYWWRTLFTNAFNWVNNIVMHANKWEDH
jgi:hypothetical protein